MDVVQQQSNKAPLVVGWYKLVLRINAKLIMDSWYK
jgi:hypothetical protein